MTLQSHSLIIIIIRRPLFSREHRLAHLLRCSPSVDHEALTTFGDFAAVCTEPDNKFEPDGHTVVAGKAADQGWWSGGQTCCLASVSGLFGICCGYRLPPGRYLGSICLPHRLIL